MKSEIGPTAEFEYLIVDGGEGEILARRQADVL